MRIARAYDEERSDEQARAFGRLGVAATKYWLNKRAVPVVAEAMEVHGGHGYAAAGADPRLDDAVAGLRELFDRVAYDEGLARLLVERMALTLQGTLLVRHAPSPVAEAFLAGRLSPGGGRVFGTLPPSVDVDALVAQAAGST